MKRVKSLTHSLLFRLLVLVTVITVVGFGFFIYETIKDNKEHILKERLKASELMSQPILHFIYKDMLVGRADLVRHHIIGLKEANGVERVQVIRNNGVEEAFQDLKTLKAVEERLGEIRPEWLVDHREREDVKAEGVDHPMFKEALDAFKEGDVDNFYYIEKTKDMELFTYVALIEARKECRRCHGETESARGFLMISTSLEDAYLDLAQEINQWIFYGIIMSIVVCLSFFVVLRLVLARRIKGMMAVSREWAGGDLGARVPIEKGDELDILADSFNYMAASLKTSRDELLENRSHLEAMLSGIADGVIFADVENRVTFINDAAEVIFGIKKEDWLGKGFEGAHSAESHRKALKMIEDMRKGRIKSLSKEVKIGKKTIIANFSPIMYGKEYLGVIFIAKNITKTKRLETELIQSEKMALVGKMSSNIAHEVRNPLVPIGGFARLIHKRLEKDSPLRKHTDIIIKEIDRLERLLNNLLYYTRDIEPVFQPVMINKLIETIIALYKDVFLEKDIKVNTDLSPDVPVTNIDPSCMKQALINILINSIHAMPNGGVLTIESSKRKKNGKLYLSISIMDTGKGIPEDVVKNIFNPFFTTRVHGMGLGLALTKRIVEAHRGEITVGSKEGKGCKFTINIPASVDKGTIG
jgi:PAS domain S-box-containing protein